MTTKEARRSVTFAETHQSASRPSEAQNDGEEERRSILKNEGKQPNAQTIRATCHYGEAETAESSCRSGNFCSTYSDSTEKIPMPSGVLGRVALLCGSFKRQTTPASSGCACFPRRNCQSASLPDDENSLSRHAVAGRSCIDASLVEDNNLASLTYAMGMDFVGFKRTPSLLVTSAEIDSHGRPISVCPLGSVPFALCMDPLHQFSGERRKKRAWSSPPVNLRKTSTLEDMPIGKEPTGKEPKRSRLTSDSSATSQTREKKAYEVSWDKGAKLKVSLKQGIRRLPLPANVVPRFDIFLKDQNGSTLASQLFSFDDPTEIFYTGQDDLSIFVSDARDPSTILLHGTLPVKIICEEYEGNWNGPVKMLHHPFNNSMSSHLPGQLQVNLSCPLPETSYFLLGKTFRPTARRRQRSEPAVLGSSSRQQLESHRRLRAQTGTRSSRSNSIGDGVKPRRKKAPRRMPRGM